MEKFKINLSIPFSGKELYLLNRNFYDIDPLSKDVIFGRRSSYHIKEEFKADWVRYPSLLPGNLLICSSEENFLFEEALSFMAQKNGIALTRDNLFAGVNLCVDRLLKAFQLERIIIGALMAKEFLPKHLSFEDRRICPMVQFETNISQLPASINNLKANYDWSWVDENFDSDFKFAFFTPSFVGGKL